MQNRTIRGLFVCLGIMLFMVVPLCADTKEQARQIFEKWQKSVITVKLTVKMRMTTDGDTQEEENTTEPTATIIDPSGLVVLSLSEADPSQMWSSMMSEGDSSKLQVDITTVTLRLADGKEMPGKLVLRDKDLDLAFIRTAQPPAEPLLALDLSQDTKPQILDEIVALGRLGEVADRTAFISLDRIQAVITKPRTLYATGVNTMMTGLGCPIFSLDGKIVGLTVLRLIPGAAGSDRGGRNTQPQPVILPAADILEVAKQAPN